MTLEQLLSLDIAGKNVLVIGMAAAGKTWLSEKLVTPNHELIHTDNIINAGYTIPQAVYSLFDDVEDCYRRGRKTLIEGILGYTLLLEGHKYMAYSPDIIIDLTISRGKQREIYLSDPKRDPEKLKYLERFHRMNLSLFNEWYSICPYNERAIYLTVENNWNYVTKVKDK